MGLRIARLIAFAFRLYGTPTLICITLKGKYLTWITICVQFKRWKTWEKLLCFLCKYFFFRWSCRCFRYFTYLLYKLSFPNDSKVFRFVFGTWWECIFVLNYRKLSNWIAIWHECFLVKLMHSTEWFFYRRRILFWGW